MVVNSTICYFQLLSLSTSMTYVNHVHRLLEFVYPSGGLVGQRVLKTSYKTAFHPFSHLGTWHKGH